MVSLYVGFYYLPFLGRNSCTQSRIMNFVYLFLCIMNFELNPTIERKDIQAKKVCSDIFFPLTLMWVGFLGVRFEVGGGGKIKLVRVMLET